MFLNAFLEVCAASCRQSVGGYALEHHIFNAAFQAEAAFVVRTSVLVDDEDIRAQGVDRRCEVEVSASAVHKSILYVSYSTDHEKTFLFREHRFVVLQFADGGIRTDAHVEPAVIGRLSEKFDVAAVQKVVATADKNCFLHVEEGEGARYRRGGGDVVKLAQKSGIKAITLGKTMAKIPLFADTLRWGGKKKLNLQRYKAGIFGNAVWGMYP